MVSSHLQMAGKDVTFTWIHVLYRFPHFFFRSLGLLPCEAYLNGNVWHGKEALDSYAPLLSSSSFPSLLLLDASKQHRDRRRKWVGFGESVWHKRKRKRIAKGKRRSSECVAGAVGMSSFPEQKSAWNIATSWKWTRFEGSMLLKVSLSLSLSL